MPKAATMNAEFWGSLNMTEGKPLEKMGAAAVSSLNSFRNNPTEENYQAALKGLNDMHTACKPVWERIRKGSKTKG